MDKRLEPGEQAPDFTLPAADGSTVSLHDLAGERVVLYFYPAAMTPGCTTQAIDFTAAAEDFAQAGVRVLGVSPDKPEKLARFAEKESISFPLLADVDRAVMNAYGAYGTKMMYGKQIEGVIRSTFVIEVDAHGRATVDLAQYNVKATGHVGRLRRELNI